ncbi:MAG: hypothetical protein JO061_14820 [Acidobacteriaceae bacterium]|nr:hypothetical protein [Acidobacteriaceae bacterium]
MSSATHAVLKFPKLNGDRSKIVQDAATQSWACGAGTFFTPQRYGDAALPLLLEQRPSEETLDEWNGIFALAAFAGPQRELSIITDRLGSLHVYKTTLRGCVLISTSSLILAALTQPDWDPIACREFLATGTVFEQRSLFRGIEKLPPATIVRFRDGLEVSRTRYWGLHLIPYRDVDSRTCVHELADALTGSIQTIARHLPQPVMDLTGGFDSRALAGSMLRAGLNFETVVNGQATDGDVLIAGRIARERQLQHRHYERGTQTPQQWLEQAKSALPLCDGEIDLLLYAPTMDVQRGLSAEFDVTLNGSNGEICKGYWWELLFPNTGRDRCFDPHKVAAQRFAYAGDPGLLAHHFDQNLTAHFAEILARNNSGLENHPNTAQMDNIYLGVRMQRWQGRIASSTARIWPCLSPFMFRDVMHVALSAPPRLRVRNRLTRRLVEHLDPHLSAIPLDDGTPAMPLRLSTAHYFWPLAKKYATKAMHRAFQRRATVTPGNKIRGLWQLEEIHRILRPDSMETAGLYEPSKLKTLLAASQQESFSSAALFGRVLTLELAARAVK